MVSYTKEANAKPRYRCRGPFRCDCKSHIAAEVETVIVAEAEAWLNRCAQKSQPREAELEIVKNRLEMRRRELDDFLKQQDAICNLYETGKYSEQLFNRRMGWLEQETRRVRKEVEREEAEVLKWKDHRQMVQEVFSTAETLLQFYDRFTPEEKNRLWKKVLQKAVYFKDETKGTVQVRIHPRA